MKKLFIVLALSFTSPLFAKDYNLQIQIQEHEKTQTIDLIAEVDNTTFAESIKSSHDNGNNPTKKMTLRDVKSAREVKKPDVIWKIDLQLGRAKVISNTSTIPNDDQATEIDLGSGDVESLRLYLSAIIKDKHELRLLFAPLSYDNNFISDEEIFFNGVKFLAGTSTQTEYQFNSYRLSYIYHFDRQGKMRYRIGFTGKIRDAYTLVRQNNVESKFENVGFVPLLHLGVNILLTDKLNLDAEIEGSWSPFGYAADIRTSLNYVIRENFQIGLGVGYLDGGASNDEVDTFARVLFGFGKIEYKF